MSKYTHTQGPWIVGPSDMHEGCLAIWADSGLHGVKQVTVILQEFSALKSNANLLGASLKMFEALEDMLDALDGGEWEDPDPNSFMSMAREAVELARREIR